MLKQASWLSWVVFLVGVLVFWFWARVPSSNVARLAGKSAPDFVFQLPSGQSKRLSDFRSKVVLLNFWASWCAPCMEEMPDLRQLGQTLGDRGLVILAVNVGEDPKVLDGLDMYKLPELLGFSSTLEAAEKYGVRGIPVSFLIDREGQVKRIYQGPRDWMWKRVRDQIAAQLN